MSNTHYFRQIEVCNQPMLEETHKGNHEYAYHTDEVFDDFTLSGYALIDDMDSILTVVQPKELNKYLSTCKRLGVEVTIYRVIFK